MTDNSQPLRRTYSGFTLTSFEYRGEHFDIVGHAGTLCTVDIVGHARPARNYANVQAAATAACAAIDAMNERITP